MLSELPRFNAARRYGVSLLVLGTVFAVLGFELLNGGTARATLPWFPGIRIPRALGFLGAALWLASAGLFSAALMSVARQKHLAVETDRKLQPARADRTGSSPAKRRQKFRAAASSLVSRFQSWIPNATMLAEWPQALLPVVFGVFAIVGPSLGGVCQRKAQAIR
jgi:hypothetical protein